LNFTGKRTPKFDVVLEDTKYNDEGILIINEIRINDTVVMLPEDSQIDIHVEPKDGVRLTLSVFPTSVQIGPGREPEEST
jgi:hypothetical protein